MDRQNGFDTVARYYDWLAKLVFGKSLPRAQMFFMNKIPPNSKVLVLGGGTGWWLSAFFSNRPECSMVYIEHSSEMLKMAKLAAGKNERIYFKIGTEDSITEVNEFDVAITACFFDLFSEEKLREVVSTIKRSIKPNGLWLVTDFIETRWWHSVLLFIMYHFFRITTKLQNQKLADWTVVLEQHNVKELDQKLFYGNFIKTAVYRVNK